jgi:hypothetical protein
MHAPQWIDETTDIKKLDKNNLSNIEQAPVSLEN